MALLAIYCAALFAVSILGGVLSALGALTHTRTQIIMSLVAGFILAIALYHLLPHGLERIPGPENLKQGMLWTTLGIVLMVGLLRMFQFHQHDFSDEAPSLYAKQAHSGAPVGGRGVAGIVIGMSIHTIAEGMALGSAIQASVRATEIAVLPAVGAFLAILLHKPLDAYSILSVMRSAGFGRRIRNLINVGFALLCPLATVAAFWLGAQVGDPFLGYALCFAAGTFLCVALSDLLPEIHFHAHDRFKLVAAFLAGVALAYALGIVEASLAHGEH